jgi:ribosome-associated protein
MTKIALKAGAPHIELCDLLKVANLCESGGAAKQMIAAGQVKVDGAVDTRKRAKIKAGQTVVFDGNTIQVVAG